MLEAKKSQCFPWVFFVNQQQIKVHANIFFMAYLNEEFQTSGYCLNIPYCYTTHKNFWCALQFWISLDYMILHFIYHLFNILLLNRWRLPSLLVGYFQVRRSWTFNVYNKKGNLSVRRSFLYATPPLGWNRKS